MLDGVLSARGMASFDELLDPPDTEALRAYLIGQAEAARNNPFMAGPPADDDDDDVGAGAHVDPAGE